MALIMEILPMLVSIVMGAMTQLWRQKAKDLHEERMFLVASKKLEMKGYEQARKYTNKHTSFSRKFLVIAVASATFIYPMILTFINVFLETDMCYHIPKEVMETGFWFFTSDTVQTKYVELCGYVQLPIYWLASEVIIGFYFGASAMRR